MPIRRVWKRLLARQNTSEATLHAFLAKHAQLAFWNEFSFATAISKLRLGADLVTDFVAVYDNHSLGIRYKLIEIEKPQTSPFTKEGIPSAGMSRAIQQVLSWRSWLEEHASEARRLFPSFFFKHDLKAVFEYEIVIGNRRNSEVWLDRRQMLAESLGISIRSFDWITHRFSQTIGFHEFSAVGDEKHVCSYETLNRLACPFVSALRDPDWREMVHGGRSSGAHFMRWYGESLAKFRKENEFAGRFRALLRRRERRTAAR